MAQRIFVQSKSLTERIENGASARVQGPERYILKAPPSYDRRKAAGYLPCQSERNLPRQQHHLEPESSDMPSRLERVQSQNRKAHFFANANAKACSLKTACPEPCLESELACTSHRVEGRIG